MCRNDTCSNNGTCIEGEGNDFSCNCRVGFEGKHCELKIDRCKSNPCSNHGQCISSIGDFKCNCPCGM